MRWIQSNGGPLVLIPESHLDKWHGVEAEPGSSTTDYDNACSVTEEIGLMKKQDIDVLVLGDEPFMTTWIPRGKGGLLLRWVYSDDERSIREFLESGFPEQPPEPCGIVCHLPGPCLLFDAAERGAEIRGDFLRVNLPTGRYEISTMLVNPSQSVRLLVHQLIAKPLTE